MRESVPPHPLVPRVPFLGSLIIKPRYFSECQYLILSINYRTEATLRMKCQMQETKIVMVLWISSGPPDTRFESFTPVLLLQSQVPQNLAQQTFNVWYFLWFRIINYRAGQNLQSSQGWWKKSTSRFSPRALTELGISNVEALTLTCEILTGSWPKEDSYRLGFHRAFHNTAVGFPQTNKEMPNMENRDFL